MKILASSLQQAVSSYLHAGYLSGSIAHREVLPSGIPAVTDDTPVQLMSVFNLEDAILMGIVFCCFTLLYMLRKWLPKKNWWPLKR
jgi:hypothetical protein